ncbi:MAG: prephenate dehydrogenase/arogenate dehydrogenase family protein [Burkholderiales bacterium]|jgi:prephenate dehydrogenase|nr:prephenate dehydrogenase/arogenate dehydrogenase family protein [Burkholderiales bacterium]
MRIERLAVVGVGLIGGSFAAALRRAGVVGRIVGVGRGRANLDDALRLGIVDEVANDVTIGVRDADFVLLAMPVGQMGTVMETLAPVLAPGAVVTDAGSTKRDVATNAYGHFSSALDRFVPAHPIAGSEKTGATAASATLFVDRNVILTPLRENTEEAVARVRAAWLAGGARVTVMTPDDHDRTLGVVSHLPHLLAFALVDLVAGRADAERLFGLAAGGFRDFTRIASSSPEMWRDICLANRDVLREALVDYRRELDGLVTMLENADSAALQQLFTRARDAREAWLRGNGGPNP